MKKALETFYINENRRYRHLRYILLPSEARKLLNFLFKYYNLTPIPIKFQKKVMFQKESVLGLFGVPELGFKLSLKFERDPLELLTVLHEFTHYLQYTKLNWDTYNVHGRRFYRELKQVTKFFEEVVNLKELK